VEGNGHGLTSGTVSAFDWWNRGNLRHISVGFVGVLSEIRTEQFSNTGQKQTRLGQLARYVNHYSTR
jgi:hypothetical protein